MASRRWLLLHGLGATGAVWTGVAAQLHARGDTVLCPDLPGHGEAAPLSAYTVPALAAALAPWLAGSQPTRIIGHSLGGYVAVALASGSDAPTPEAVWVLGTKLHFSAQERARLMTLAARPARLYASRAEALERYRTVAGFAPTLALDDPCLARGVIASAQGWHLATDPKAYALDPTPFAQLLRAVRCPVAAACGRHDPLVDIGALRAHVPAAVLLEGLGHNAQVEAPGRVLDWVLDRGEAR